MKSPYERSYISLAMRSQEYDCTSIVQDIVQGIEMIHNWIQQNRDNYQPSLRHTVRRAIKEQWVPNVQ